MTQRLGSRFLSDVLDDLEDLELPLLAWGVTTGTLAHSEVLDAINDRLLNSPRAPEAFANEVLSALQDAALLFRIPATSPPRYRTRMAETVRLTTRLRQLFGPRDLTSPPAHWWEQGRTLVADYRLHTARRRYPRRAIAVDDALRELAGTAAWTEVHTHAARAQLNHPTVARFQVDATRAITQALHSGESNGVIVGAGTGSGKTLGFYLPAFAAMAEHARKGGGGVHTLALYPRIELLRDQLREAVAAVLRINASLKPGAGRRLRLGVLYGATPHNAEQLQARKSHSARAWAQRGADLLCPYLACPHCRRDLVWSRLDQAANRDRLRCTYGACGLVIDDVVLTRDKLRSSAPDLLFTTTEMLNRNATDPGLGRLLGWRGPRRPSLVLLDEVHTYTGMHGAQVGLLLRRWRHAMRNTITFVGLSATLRDAKAFFAQLTGLPDASVDYVTPQPQDLEEEGREYALAVRADPVSGASQLSTSIQTAMLYGRVLDLRDREQLYGSRGFLFTDDLDVTNRFYDDLRDAEGGIRSGRGRVGRVLAGLRSPEAPFRAERFNDGQSWDLVRQIGHNLDPNAVVGELRVGRTSSQDVGVDDGADLVVATASLEVGYDDDRVGLVLQHKAPYDAAAFIQRRGRAGRRRGTRPWTVVTLSDYGRDRLAYQAYDSLFSPELTARRLPIRNRFVLKIQGAQALLDWLAATLPNSRIDPRRLLTAPRPEARPSDTELEQVLANLLERLITDPVVQDSLVVHLRRALGITADEAQALLWEQPRALLLSVAPTALRRLRSRWRPVDPDPGAQPGSLLPDYLTTALYEPLNVPEVNFRLPFAEDPEALPIERALREAVPGRVSRRYGYQSNLDRTWLPLPAPGVDGKIEISSFVETHSPQGMWAPVGHQPVEVLRPYVIRLQRPPEEVADRSQGVPVWGSEILEPASGLYAGNIPKPSAWTDRITAVGFATTAAGNPAEVRRMTLGAECETLYERGTVRRVSSNVRYCLEGQPAALGFRLNVDAVRFELAPLDATNKAVAEYLTSPEWRLLAFNAAMAEDPALDGIANSFQRNWLTTVYTAAYALAATEPNLADSPGGAIHASLRGGKWRDDIQQVLRALYRDATSEEVAAHDRLVVGLTELSADNRLTDRLDHHARLLWTDDIRRLTADLAQRVYRDTVAAAILAATQRACPDAQDRDLIVDVIPLAQGNDHASIWLSETSLGGIGIIEQLVVFYTANPRRFWGLVDSALGPSDHDYVHSSVLPLLDHVVSQPSGAAAQAMSALREARSARAADAALQQLRTIWATLTGHPRHQAIAAVSTRLLRPGTTSATDATALDLVRAWDALQQRLGFEVEAAVFAYLVSAGRLAVPIEEGASLTADQVFSLLWPRGSKARVQHLQHYQPYAGPPIIDRLLAQAAHDERLPVVDLEDPDWLAAYRRAICERSAVVLAAPAHRTPAFATALRTVPAVAVDRDVLRVYGEIRSVSRDSGLMKATIEIREAAQ
ncbi:protein DpdJ [Micromonospora sp. NPDC007220]|uniref:protein DpdJ n=1 Tax=Micromonospora sp. NPDC007220 TaxID=3154318 RepID=UPI0033DFF32E